MQIDTIDTMRKAFEAFSVNDLGALDEFVQIYLQHAGLGLD